MRVFAKLFAAFDDPSGQKSLETLEGLAESSEDFELVDHNPSIYGDLELAWTVNSELPPPDPHYEVRNGKVLQRRK